MEQLYQSRYTGPEIDRRLGLMAGNFLWIKWSNTFPVATMLDEPGPYIGIYAGESNDPPADPAEYKWYLNKGNDGLTGPKGDKGDAGDKGDKGDTGDQGPKGDTGAGLDILGTYSTLAALEAAVPSPAQGDMYNVGLAAPYNIYMWDVELNDWKDQGVLQGPQGEKGDKGNKGDKGDKGDPGQDGAAGVPGPNEITADTSTPLSGILVAENGTVREGVAGDVLTALGVNESLLADASIAPTTQFTVAGQSAYTLFVINCNFTQMIAYRVDPYIVGFGVIGSTTTSWVARLVITVGANDVWTYTSIYMIPLNSGSSVGTIEYNAASRLIKSVTGII